MSQYSTLIADDQNQSEEQSQAPLQTTEIADMRTCSDKWWEEKTFTKAD